MNTAGQGEPSEEVSLSTQRGNESVRLYTLPYCITMETDIIL